MLHHKLVIYHYQCPSSFESFYFSLYIYIYNISLLNPTPSKTSSVQMKRKPTPMFLYPSPIKIALITYILLVRQGLNNAQDTNQVSVGFIFDLDTWIGRIVKSCVTMALTDYYSAHNETTTRLVLHTRDSNEDVLDAASSAIDLIKYLEVQAILGPLSSSQAEFVVDIGNRTQVPVISFSATSPSISSTKTPYFIRTALNDSTQVKAIAAVIQAFGWREVVPVYEDTDYGEDMIPYLTDAIQDVNARVPYRSVFSSSFTDDQIRGELYKLMTMQTRVFVVHMTLPLGSRLFSVAKEIGMMKSGYAWIITDGLTDFLSSMNGSVIDSMQGVLGIKPHVPGSDKLDNFRSRWKRNFLQDNPDIDGAELSGLALWAYDSIWALATAVEKVNTFSPRFKKQTVGNYSTDLETLGISQIGSNLLASLLRTKFSGLSGEFWLKDGQLQSSAFQIVNVIGKGGREIGFWSPSLGISQKLDVPIRKTYSTFKGDLRAIIWPGESTEVPKGWELTTREKQLKIGVPMKDGFSEFVKVHKDPHTNATLVTGFCIDVFKAVIDSMPYAVPYEFVPFVKDDGQIAGNYNTLVDQVYFQIYDAVVGDVTILGNRSQHVDFTLPYTESGVSMVVPFKDDQRKNAWIFLKPLTTELWLTSGAFFILTGFVVWALEHRVNKDFRGKPAEQVGMIFWFSFSTLVFAHKERVTSNLARFVLLIWIFIVLILTSSYTASLTSMLTVQQLQPTVRDINDLKKKGEFIGYQTGSFVTELMEGMGLDRSKFKPYDTLEECHEALSKGTSNGGVSAIFDEIPYIKLLLGKYCKKYMMVGPTHRTAGFGFVFPKGSALVPDISRAILKVTEGEKMDAIEHTWFGHQTSCPEQGGSTITSDRLTVDSFKGLFLIAGVSSTIAIILFLFKFLHEHKNILVSKGSITQKFSSMAVEFDKEKDTSSRGSSNGRVNMGRESHAAGFDTSCPQSPVTSITVFPYTEPNTPCHDCQTVLEMTSSN